MMNLEKLEQKLDKKELAKLPISEKELCERYEELYTGAVNDVLREHALLDQALPNEIMPLAMEMKAAGIAYTIRSVKDPSFKGEMEKRAEMLDDMPRECMVVWDTGGETEAAHWGEVMTASAIARGARGAVIEGGLRDTMQVLAQNFPVFHKYRSSNGTLGRCKITAYNVSVKIGKVTIYPGDLIFADVDGALVVPREIAYEVLVRAEEIKKGEQEIRSWVKEGFSAKKVVERGGYF
ncbi:RraA family protein [Catalinimonas sp. 4WD22]|uniref:RraA family protein n=1 Tax=Catalinimonas locisalis TaxID=3133978 RepID=UPI0031013DC5